MGSPGDLRPGAVVKHNGQNYAVVEHRHVTPGKGPAHHQAKLRNLETGKLSEARYRSNESIDFVRVERHDYQFLYRDGDMLYFMNVENYEQVPVLIHSIGDEVRFLKENQDVKIAFEGDIILAVEMPLHVNLKVEHTEPGLRGDTATNVLKPATLETGAEVQVPLFINEDDVIRVDTRTGDYIERVKE